MANVLTLPTVEQNSLGRLGAGILAGVSGLADRRRFAEREAQRREQFLADVGGEREYQAGVRGTARSQMLEDETRKLDLVRKEELRAAGLLTPADFDNAVAVAEAQAKQMEDLSKQAERRRTLPKQAQDAINAIQTQLSSAMSRMRNLSGERAALDDLLSRELPTPSDRAIMERAEQEAGKGASSEEIQAQIPRARDSLIREMFPAFAVQQQSAQQRARLIEQEFRAAEAEIQNLRIQGSQIGSQFGVVPTQMAVSAGTLSDPGVMAAPQASVISRAPNEREMQSFAEMLAGPAPAPSGQAAVQPGPSAPAPQSRGLLGIAESIPYPREVISAALPVIAEMPRQAERMATGLLTGDFSEPEKGLITRAGEAIGSLFSPDPFVFSAEDRVLREQPYSPKAMEIRRRRAQEATAKAKMLAEPVNTAPQFVPPAALRLQIAEPPRY